jgi:ribA/ribD-fused uncharacterized protein
MTIKFYKIKDPYGYMSNYKKARFFIYDRWWNWVEAPYQAKKCDNQNDYELIYNAKTNNESRLLGQKVKMRYDWDQIKVEVMSECVLAKFLQHKDLRDQLMATGDEELVEDSPIDYFWGCGADGTGKNNLGKVIMAVREKLKGE